MKRHVNVVFEGSIPENYDRYLGPVLFEPFADDVAARLKEAQPESVATDLNPGMFYGHTCADNSLQAFVWGAVRE
jgi:hypothetical protein